VSAPQAGYLEPTSGAGGDAGAGGPFTVAGIFGKEIPVPIILSGGPADNYMDMGGFNPVIAPMSGVQTVDSGQTALGLKFKPDARNLLRPMHSPGFWILLIALLALGLFSASGNLRLGPVRFGANVGK
jgi:hypothetical protein